MLPFDSDWSIQFRKKELFAVVITCTTRNQDIDSHNETVVGAYSEVYIGSLEIEP